jgi:hypothetical protein
VDDFFSTVSPELFERNVARAVVGDSLALDLVVYARPAAALPLFSDGAEVLDLRASA